MARGDGTILDPNVHEAFIRNYAQQRGVDPDFVARLAAAEGLTAWSAANPNAGNNPALSRGRSISYGDFQLNTSNGLGVTARQHGIDPTNPNQWQAADKFAIDYIAQTHDLTPWQTNPVGRAYVQQHGAGNPGAFNPAASAGTANMAQTAPTITPDQISAARAWLHGVSEHPDRPGDTDNLNPFYAVKLAGAMQEARNQGINVTLESGFRDKNELANQQRAAGRPLSNAAQFDAAGNSEHSYGIASDIGGIGQPGSASAKKWYDIATAHGLYNPYGWQHQTEWNHYQMTPKPLNAPENAQLLASLKAAPNIQAAWAAMPTPEGSAGGSPAPAPAAVSGGGGVAPSLPAPPTPLQQMGATLGAALSSFGGGGGGGGGFQDPPPDMPIRMPGLQGIQPTPQPDYLGRSAASSSIGTLSGGSTFGDEGGITAGAPSMTSMAVGTGTPLTGVGAESPLTYPTAMPRYSRI